MAEIAGSSQGDILFGSAAGDLISGLAGDDWIYGEGGSDTIQGGSGNDGITLSGNSTQPGTWGGFVYGGDGNDILVSTQLSAWGAQLNPGLGTNTVIGSAALWDAGDGDDLMHDDLVGVGGLTVSMEADGSGTVVSGDGRVHDTFVRIQWFALTSQDDSIVFSNNLRWKGCAPGAGSDTIIGGDGVDDVFYGTQTGRGIVLNLAAGTIIDPWGATDFVSAIESFRGSLDSDAMDASGGEFSVTLDGLAGNDTLMGGTLGDTLTGGGGDDRLAGGSGDDRLYGGTGDDLIDDGTGIDTIDGGEGIDTFQRHYDGTGHYSTVLGFDLGRGRAYDPATPKLAAEVFVGIENLAVSGEFTFLLTGDRRDNLLQADRGNDTLAGAGGADSLLGGGGKDRLTGGAGWDWLSGGGGADLFVFESLGGVDSVSDFATGTDRFVLSREGFAGIGGAGSLRPGAFHAKAGATGGHDAGDRIIYDTTTGALYFDADGQGGATALQFAQLGTQANHPYQLGASDFQIV